MNTKLAIEGVEAPYNINLMEDENSLDARFGNFKVFKHFEKGDGTMGLISLERKREEI